MKTSLLVFLSLLLFTACSPVSPQTQPQALPAEVGIPLQAPLNRDKPSQASWVSQPESASLPQPLLEVLDLAEQRRNDLAAQAGWYHIQTRHVQTEPNPLSPFTSGLNRFEQEQWLALDEKGRMERAIRIISDEAGKTLQITVLAHGSWVNLTLGAVSQTGAGDSFDPNYGFDQLAERLVRQGYALNKSILYKECWFEGEKFTISEGQIMHEAVFDIGYRELRWIKTWQVTSKGEVSLVDSLEVMVEERVDQPPAEVLALLGQDPASQ